MTRKELILAFEKKIRAYLSEQDTETLTDLEEFPNARDFLYMWCKGDFAIIIKEDDEAYEQDEELAPHESPLAFWADIVNELASEELEKRNDQTPGY